jgi:hypothetical protein
MEGMAGRVLGVVRARVRIAFSRANIAWAASGAAIAVATLAAASVFALRGFVYVNPAGVVLYSLMGASLSLALRQCFLVARTIRGVGMCMVRGSTGAVALGTLWFVLLAAVGAREWGGWREFARTETILLAMAGPLLSLWVEAPGPRAGLFHSMLKAVACAWFVFLVCFLAIVGPSGQVKSMNHSARLMWLNLAMAWDVSRVVLLWSAPFLLPPMMGLAVWLWFRDRRRPDSAAPAAAATPEPAPPRPAAGPAPADDLGFRPAAA